MPANVVRRDPATGALSEVSVALPADAAAGVPRVIATGSTYTAATNTQAHYLRALAVRGTGRLVGRGTALIGGIR
ncbi:hypothetical protein K8Z61_18575 [Nocardioides sp. TRM66260-LWL]|nr:hypothetical protein [Nocardioides sp. TRM66260-LWL]